MWAQILSQSQPGKQPSWPGDEEISPPYLEVQPPRGADRVCISGDCRNQRFRIPPWDIIVRQAFFHNLKWAYTYFASSLLF